MSSRFSNPPALVHFLFIELKPLLGLLAVPPMLIAEVLNGMYEDGGPHSEILCGLSYGQAKSCVETFAAARVWSTNPPLPPGCEAGKNFLLLKEFSANASDFFGRSCISPDQAAGGEFLSTLLPGVPFVFNILGLLMVLPLYALLLRHFFAGGGWHWGASDAAYLRFTSCELHQLPWVSQCVVLTAVGSLSLCLLGVAYLVSVGGMILAFLQSAVPILFLQFISLRAILDVGGGGWPTLELKTDGESFGALTLRRELSWFFCDNRTFLREFEVAALIGDPAAVEQWLTRGTVAQALLTVADCRARNAAEQPKVAGKAAPAGGSSAGRRSASPSPRPRRRA